MKESLAWIMALAAVVIATALSVLAYQTWRANAPPRYATTHYAVLLLNGQAYFGRVEKVQSEHMVFKEVFYIQSRTNPETKQVTNVLVKRGQEWHAPDRLILNRRHVILMEPVTEGSQVAKLIAEQSTQK